MNRRGACQFDAMADQLKRRGIVGQRDMQQVQAQLCAWIEQNAERHVLENGMTLAGWIRETQQCSLPDYLRRMRLPNEWGDDVTLLACVECFQVEVLLWTSTEGNQHEVRSLRPQGGRRFCDVLHLGLILDFHYWSLIPVQDGPLGSYRGEETVLDRPFVLWFDAKADEKILEDSNLLLHQPVLTVSAQAKLGDLLQGLFVVNYRGIHFHRRIFNDEQRQEVVDALLVGTSSSSLFSPSAHARARIPYHRAEGEEDSLLEASETCMMILFCLFVFFFFFFLWSQSGFHSVS